MSGQSLVDSVRDGSQPWQPIGIVERPTGTHLRDIGGGMKIVIFRLAAYPGLLQLSNDAGSNRCGGWRC
jgi:hypothetical protein